MAGFPGFLGGALLVRGSPKEFVDQSPDPEIPGFQGISLNPEDVHRSGQETLAEQPGHETAGSGDHAEQPEDSGVRRSSPNDSASRSYSSTVIRWSSSKGIPLSPSPVTT